MSQDNSKGELERANASKSALPELHKTTGWRIETTTHARSQALIRHPLKTAEDWQSLHRNIVHGLISAKDKNNGTHLIYSASHDHGVIAAVNHKKKEIHVVTVLEHKKQKMMHPDDHKIIVEDIKTLSFREWINA